DLPRARSQHRARASGGRRRRLRLERDGPGRRRRRRHREREFLVVFHSLLALWFRLSLEWGYAGVFMLMGLESTVFPIPSELIIPPAAYWAEQGRFHFWGVVAVATLGSWLGSALSYWVAAKIGRPLILKYGKYVFVPEKKWLLAESWILRFSAG